MLESEKSKDVLNSSDEADLRKESEADAPEYAESDSGSVEFSNTESESCASKSGDEGAASEGQNLEGAQESPLSSPGVLGRLPKSGTPFSLQFFFLLLWLFSPSCLQRM